MGILIGNKVDLVDERQVTTEAAKEFAEKEGLFFMEVSALTNLEECVHKAFNLLVEGTRLLTTRNREEKRTTAAFRDRTASTKTS
jgi:ribosome biogenesis GTPase A